ncbi:ACP S-malonyltransferase [Halobacillus sp. Marseille-P3879]|uniref:ACP S-malonyltransferase n=1 Tax=Halobacillus sp. Marseille-P3879 TaxID=2045014 RepID=UPI000C7993E7|nr:malonate decarboxylase subunit epsilon [Halobacillus sp. Marseille-P3879]
MSTVFLFPGQGSQKPRMFQDLPDHPVVRKVFEEASDELDESVYQWDVESKLSSTIAVQICLLVSGVASARVLKEKGAVPDFVAGHSVGTFGAAVVAGALEFKDAVRLVRMRGEWMEQSFKKGYGMGVVTGLGERQLNGLIDEYNQNERNIYLANLNSSRQMTIAGSLPELRRFMEIAIANHAQKAELLDVAVPSHCSLLNELSLKLEAELDRLSVKNPEIPYAGNLRGRVLRRGEAIKKDLAWNVSHSVHWHEATSLLYELGVRLFVEMLPGNVLTKLAEDAFPEARAISISDDGSDTAAILVNRL